MNTTKSIFPKLHNLLQKIFYRYLDVLKSSTEAFWLKICTTGVIFRAQTRRKLILAFPISILTLKDFDLWDCWIDSLLWSSPFFQTAGCFF